MEQNNAFYVLISFKPLLGKVKDNSMDIELTKEEKEKLHKFIDLWSSGCLDNARNYRRAGLNKSDINILIQLAENHAPEVRSRILKTPSVMHI